MMEQICEVVICNNITINKVCESCRKKLIEKHKIEMCKRCGVITKVTKGVRDIIFIEKCYSCTADEIERILGRDKE